MCLSMIQAVGDKKKGNIYLMLKILALKQVVGRLGLFISSCFSKNERL